MVKKRILETMNSSGKSTYYPQRKILNLFWCGYEGYNERVEFDTLNEARDWMLYEAVVKVWHHDVSTN